MIKSAFNETMIHPERRLENIKKIEELERKMNRWKELKPGDPVFVWNEVRPYRVKCRDERFIICTKPFNPKRTVMYFIVDLERYIRGTDNSVFCSGYETQEQCEERLKELQEGRIEVSYRNYVPLD